MKIVIPAVMIVALMALTSCSKNAPNPGGYWTFRTVTYYTTMCTDSFQNLSASNLNVNELSNLSYLSTIDCAFADTLPVTGGTYTVISAMAPRGTASQAAIFLSIPGSVYISMGTNDTSQTVHVTVTGGKVTATAKRIKMVNINNQADTSAVTFSITQL